jgi:DNA-directed DNA polymerase III PolC
MKLSPHSHMESPLTGSTIKDMILRAEKLGRTHIAYTDHGHLSSALKIGRVHKEIEKEEKRKIPLKHIVGLEIYFKDIACPIVSGTKADRCKYFTGTLYCKDQEAFQALSKVVSREDFPKITIFEQEQQLWSWKNLEELSQKNIDFVAGGPHCMVGKTFLAGEPQLAQKVFIKLKEIFKDNFYCAVLAEPWEKKWHNVVQIKYKDGTQDSLLTSDRVYTDRAKDVKVAELIDNTRHTKIFGKVVNGLFSSTDKTIDVVTLHKGFLPLPGGDVTLRVNKLLLGLAKKYEVRTLVTDYAYYADKEDKIVQTMRMEGSNKLQPNLHMKTTEEVVDYLTLKLGMTPEAATQIMSNNDEWANRFDGFKLKYDWHLAESGGDPLKLAMDIIKQNGRMKWNDPKYTNRLREELQVIAKNPKFDLTSYFLPIRDVLNFYKDSGFLTGPGRGSAGGSLFAYLLGITQIDPFAYDLPFQRFFSLDRIMLNELPDIDVDLEDREPLVGKDTQSGYLYGRWGDKAAQISTRTTIRLKSAILDTNRYFKGKVEDSIASLSKGFPAPPQGISDHDFVFGFEDDDDVHHPGLIEISDDLKKYSETRPEEWAIVSKAMGLTRAFSKHASAFILSDIAISDIVPVKDRNVTQYEAKECEAAGLIKYDFLVVSQLKDIRVCMELINKKNANNLTVGNFAHNGANTYVWDLPHDPEVFKSIWGGEVSTLFQINTKSMQPFVMEILPGSIMDLATILALVRPGPMDFIDEKTGRNMVEEYVQRRNGLSSPDIKELADLLPETYGIITFQEQLNKIARDLAGFPGDRAEFLRKYMAKKKMKELMEMKPDFMAGAKQRVSPEIAEAIWDRMVTFGRYGFSIIHAVEYAHITYACMFFKHHYPMEWWAAVLTNAGEQEITTTFWPYVRDFVLPPDINLSGDTMVVDYNTNKIRSKLGVIRGMGENTIGPILEGRPYADIKEFVNKDVAGQSLSHKLIHVGVLDSLFPPGVSAYEKHLLYERAVELKDFNDKMESAKLTGKKVRATQPKEAKVPDDYINIPALQDIAMKKAVLPSLPVELHKIARKESKYLDKEASIAMAIHTRNGQKYRSQLIDGEKMKKLDEINGESLQKDIYVAATCFVIQAKEFAYAKNTKKALKLVLDIDGYVSEKVLWPEYESGQLVYPSGVKKGAIVTVFFRKRMGKKSDASIQAVYLET